MSVVAEFTIPPEALPGGDALRENPGMRVELERIVPTGESALPFFWVWGDDPVRFMERAERDANVSAVELLDRVQGGALFRARWRPKASLIEGIRELNAVVVEAVGTSERWRFEVRTEERAAFNQFRELFRREEITVDLSRIYDLSELVEGDARTMTPEQRETLLTAYREGYFDQPRGATQADVADHFDVSRRAVSDRLRRGVQTLVASSLLPSHERD